MLQSCLLSRLGWPAGKGQTARFLRGQDLILSPSRLPVASSPGASGKPPASSILSSAPLGAVGTDNPVFQNFRTPSQVPAQDSTRAPHSLWSLLRLFPAPSPGSLTPQGHPPAPVFPFPGPGLGQLRSARSVRLRPPENLPPPPPRTPGRPLPRSPTPRCSPPRPSRLQGPGLRGRAPRGEPARWRRRGRLHRAAAAQ